MKTIILIFTLLLFSFKTGDIKYVKQEKKVNHKISHTNYVHCWSIN